jgi:hypothetical protein
MGKKRDHDGCFYNAHGQVVDEPLDYTEWLERERDRLIVDRDALADMLQEGVGLLAGHDLYCAQEEIHDDVCMWMDRARTLLHNAKKDVVP